MNWRARLFISAICTVGLGLFAYVMSSWHPHWTRTDLFHFLAYLALGLITWSLKIVLPGIDCSMSVGFLFVLMALLQLNVSEIVLIITLATILQCVLARRTRIKFIQVAFNVGNLTTAITITHKLLHLTIAHLPRPYHALLLIAAAAVYFLLNNVPVATVIALTSENRLREIWSEHYFWSMPYYLGGGALASAFTYLMQHSGWQAGVAGVPLVFLIYRSYRLYTDRLEAEAKHSQEVSAHSQEVSALHLRTIEALALAIDAKDHTTHDHLQRVRVYATEIAKELNLSEPEMEALRAAALLHDIGKLAVPEHILNKPGKLTLEEFEKMKIHPVIGAEILERVNFPYPVAPIVRAHHEKWDGSGYPAGLKGEEIPIGARILSAVDCLDALATDRQYRRALPLDKAMEIVAAESGRQFDPVIVEILKRRYVELEQMARSSSGTEELAKLSVDVKVERGQAPAAGLARNAQTAQTHESFLAAIAAAREEAQTLYEMSSMLGSSLSLDETLSMFSSRLKKQIAYDSIAIYLASEDRLTAVHASGDDFRLFSSLEIPVGQGLSGWVFQNEKHMLNGNPSVEASYLKNADTVTTMRSALAVPLQAPEGVIGTLTLYRREPDAFTPDDLRIVLAVSTKVALAIDNALKYQRAESSATTDYLTGLPNARSLFIQLDHELSRAKRGHSGLGLMVCDLDNFKQINDCYGHLTGNKVLQLFAQSLRGVFREYDYAARMGGDEFVVVVPGLVEEAAAAKVLALRRVISEISSQLTGEASLGVSVGVAFFPEDGTDAEQLLAEADRKMYNVKKASHGERRSSSPARAHVMAAEEAVLMVSNN